MSFQQITVLGNLGKDVETRYTADQKAIASFSIAVTEKSSGQEHTEWFNCTAFGKTAEVASQYLSKGSKCLVTGRLKTEKYTDKQGAEKTSVKVIVDRLSLEGDKKTAQSTQASRPNEKPSNDFEDDRIPF